MASECPVPGIPGAIIRKIVLPEHLPGGRRTATNAEYLDDTVFFTVPGVARYCLRNGNLVEVHPLDGADPAAVDLFACDPARGALIHQRRELPLEACALLTPAGRGVALCGPSAVGKSTLAAELTRRGWRLLTDGVTRVTMDEDGVVAWPSSGAVKLWRDACVMLGLDTNNLERVRAGADRFFIDVPSAADTPRTLDVIVKMSVGAGATFKELALDMSDRRRFIAEHIYKPRHAALLGHPGGCDSIVAGLAQTARLCVLNGARTAPVDELAGAVSGALA